MDASNLLTVTDAKSQQTVYTPNNMNRRTTRRDPLLRTETYSYDNNGNLATVLDRKSQTTTSTYDPLNRRTKATFQDGSPTHYTYDVLEQLVEAEGEWRKRGKVVRGEGRCCQAFANLRTSRPRELRASPTGES